MYQGSRRAFEPFALRVACSKRIVDMHDQARIAVVVRVGHDGVAIAGMDENDASHQRLGEAPSVFLGDGKRHRTAPASERGPSPLDRRTGGRRGAAITGSKAVGRKLRLADPLRVDRHKAMQRLGVSQGERGGRRKRVRAAYVAARRQIASYGTVWNKPLIR